MADRKLHRIAKRKLYCFLFCISLIFHFTLYQSEAFLAYATCKCGSIQCKRDHKITTGHASILTIDSNHQNFRNSSLSDDPVKLNQHISSKLKKNKIDSKLEKINATFLLIDNYDSFTYNLYQYFADICVVPPIVIKNDDIDLYEEVINNVDGIIISPGPGNPKIPNDVGICRDAILNNPSLPILGVCLGHQLMGYLYNAYVLTSPRPMHGLITTMLHDETNAKSYSRLRNHTFNLFDGIPETFEATRYHSLIVDVPDSADVEAIAWGPSSLQNKYATERKKTLGSNRKNNHFRSGIDDLVMALRHKTLPHWGVQFHPESIGSDPYGKTLIRNFSRFAEKWKNNLNFSPSVEINNFGTESVCHNGKYAQIGKEKKSKYRVIIHEVNLSENSKISVTKNPEILFENLFGSKSCAFWLDSSSSSESCPQNSRFSIMGGEGGPDCKIIEYYGNEHDEISRGIYVDGEKVNDAKGGIIDYLKRHMAEMITDDFELASLSLMPPHPNNKGDEYSLQHEMNDTKLPFQYRGGFVGYLGYEIRHDTMPVSQSQRSVNQFSKEKSSANKHVPTAAFLFADRSLVLDHLTGQIYLVGLASRGNENKIESKSINETIRWMSEIHTDIVKSCNEPKKQYPKQPNDEVVIQFRPSRSKSTYYGDILRCHEEIKKGESFELCLTNQLHTTVTEDILQNSVYEKNSVQQSEIVPDPFGLYKVLRGKNPSPYGAFLKFDRSMLLPSQGRIFSSQRSTAFSRSSIALCCSSPERFLSIKPNLRYMQSSQTLKNNSRKRPLIIESKPIKGTCARGLPSEENNNDSFQNSQFRSLQDKMLAEELRLSIKNRAENLMIVDLLRNDMSRVCRIGSVHVPHLMEIESYETVHQLVSTIRGELTENATAFDAIEACFPGGSMTGAPKHRTISILDEFMECGHPRGPYSGSLGYFSLNGSMDMNIIIRTAVVTPSIMKLSKNDTQSQSSRFQMDISIGAGGAITALSDCEDEYEEMMLKARALMDSVNHWCNEIKNDYK